MATLLDEILQEINATYFSGKCSAGCTCAACNVQKAQSYARHKNWRQRRNDRVFDRKVKSVFKPRKYS